MAAANPGPEALPPEAAFEAALALRQQGNAPGAEALCAEILRIDARHFQAHHLRGLIALDRGDIARGIECIQRSLAINPAQPVAHSNLGNALRSLGRCDEALASYNRALALNGQYVPALNNRGLILDTLGRLDEARASFERAQAVDPHFAPAQENLAAVLLKLDRKADSLAVSDRLLQWAPNNSRVLCARGDALLALDQPAPAVASYTRAIECDPGNFEALLNRGAAFQRMGRLEEALADSERALALRPDSVRALVNSGNDHIGLGRAQQALSRFERAVLLAPEDCDALHGRAAALLALGRDDAAGPLLEDVLRLRPHHALALEQLFHLGANSCDWRDWLPDRLRESLRMTRSFVNPLTLLMFDEPEQALACARAFSVRKYPPDSALGALPPPERRSRDGKVRLAYVSADFCAHPVAQSLVRVLELHDRSRFEVLGFSLRAQRHGPFEQRVHDAFDRCADVSARSDRDVALLMREWGVDIAVDLMGFTEGFRLGVFAHRPAPVQVGFLGFAGTVGAPYMDYILGDGVVFPGGSECWYSERMVRLPHCYLPTDDRRGVAETPTRELAGLPPRGIVLCAFTKAHKITRAVFALWMRLLQSTPGSVLWLRDMGERAQANLIGAAASFGVEAQRLIFAPHAPGMAEHLSRQGLADLYLDTLPYNAHSTACDALSVGVPVITCAGTGFASRVAASALMAAGLPELVTNSLKEYERRALELLQQPERLLRLRSRLASQRARMPLFDTTRFTRNLEIAFLEMHRRSMAGEQPQAFDVSAGAAQGTANPR